MKTPTWPRTLSRLSYRRVAVFLAVLTLSGSVGYAGGEPEDLLRQGAIEEARALLAGDPSPRARYLLGHTYFHQGAGKVQNIDLPGELPQRGDRASQGVFPYNWDNWRQGDYAAARVQYRAVIEDGDAEETLRQQALFWYALSYRYEGRIAPARAALRELLERPGLGEALTHFAWYYLAESYLQEEAWHEARKASVRNLAAAIRPTHRWTALSALDFAWRSELSAARAALHRGQAQEALRRLETFFSHPPLPCLSETVSAEAALAVRTRLGLPEQGDPFRMRPRDHAEGYLLLGDALAALGRDREAAAAWGEVGTVRAPASDEDFIGEALLRLARQAAANGRRRAVASRVRTALQLPGLLPATRAELEKLARASGYDPVAWSVDYGYGAEGNPTGQPIGGGLDYTDHTGRGDWVVASPEALEQALAAAAELPFETRKGKVVRVAAGARLDLTAIAPVTIPDGVTLAGDRGKTGAAGPLLYFTDTRSATLVVLGSRARLTGLRLRGSSPDILELTSVLPAAYPPRDRGPEALRDGEPHLRAYLWGNHQNTAVAIRGEHSQVDNCEISHVLRGISTGPYATVRHNRLHNIHSYPLSVGHGHSSLFEANLVDWTWHAIATSSGMRSGNWEARFNIFRERVPNGYGEGMSQVFGLDAHAQGDRYLVHHNTFLFMDDEAFGVPNRSIGLSPPWEVSQIYRNRFTRPMLAEEAVYWLRMRPVPERWDLFDIVTARDIGDLSSAYLRERYPDPRTFDMRQTAATNRANDGEIGGFNFWVYDNAFGPDDAILPYTDYTTPRIALYSPQHRRPRNSMRGGRGGNHHPPLDLFRGTLPIDFKVATVPGIALREVGVDLVSYEHDAWYPWFWGRVTFALRETLYRAPQPPAPGSLLLDTRRLANGVYGLFVTATDERGHAARIYTFFEVSNQKDG